MAFDVKEKLIVDNILKKISQYDIFKTYCIPFRELSKLFISELREDKNPTCSIFIDRTNGTSNPIYHDFNGNSYNCFQYVMTKYGVNFNEALNIINRDFKLNLRSSWSNKSLEFNTNIKISTNDLNFKHKIVKINKRKRSWSDNDRNYWTKNYDITIPTLEYFKVEPIDFYWINDDRFKCDNTTYSYEFNEGKRDIYAPLNKLRKWPASNTKAIKHIYGWNQLPTSGEVVFIVSSLKEVVFLYEFDIISVAPQSESSFLPINKIDELKSRFTNVIILFDFDFAGCKLSSKWAIKYNLQWCKFCPVFVNIYGFKDLTDGYTMNKELVLNILNNYEIYL